MPCGDHDVLARTAVLFNCVHNYRRRRRYGIILAVRPAATLSSTSDTLNATRARADTRTATIAGVTVSVAFFTVLVLFLLWLPPRRWRHRQHKLAGTFQPSEFSEKEKEADADSALSVSTVKVAPGGSVQEQLVRVPPHASRVRAPLGVAPLRSGAVGAAPPASEPVVPPIVTTLRLSRFRIRCAVQLQPQPRPLRRPQSRSHPLQHSVQPLSPPRSRPRSRRPIRPQCPLLPLLPCPSAAAHPKPRRKPRTTRYSTRLDATTISRKSRTVPISS
jgi:hypothetical protein